KVALYTAPSSVSDHITANVLEDDAFVDGYLKTNAERLADAFSFSVRWLRERGIPYAPGANAAFFLWVDLGAVYLRNARKGGINGVGGKEQTEGEDVTAVVTKKLLDHRVFLASGEQFGSERPGWFRIVFSQPREELEEGMRRMAEALNLRSGN
ncbi:hypothetical protein LTS18_008810, partial [Coniosporium uncinatum]